MFLNSPKSQQIFGLLLYATQTNQRQPNLVTLKFYSDNPILNPGEVVSFCIKKLFEIQIIIMLKPRRLSILFSNLVIFSHQQQTVVPIK